MYCMTQHCAIVPATGTTMFWVLENTHPEFTKARVASMSALGPVAFVGHARSPIKILAPFNREIHWVSSDLLRQRWVTRQL